MSRPSGLGRGLGALIPPKPVPVAPNPTGAVSSNSGSSSETVSSESSMVAETGTRVLQIPIQSVTRNPHQPHVQFEHAALEDLIQSIKEHGVIQPIVVTELGGGRYELIAGERRLRASTIAGLETVPAIVRTANDQQKLELAIIENVQRQDLNPIEEARAYIRLMEEFHLTQDEVSQKVGKSRPQVGNLVRLLQLPEEIQQALIERKISASNARTLLSLPTESERLGLFQQMLAGNFTVRQTEARVSHPRRVHVQDPNIAAVESRLREALHCRVDIKRDARGEGEIKLTFTSDEELNQLLNKLTGKE